MRVKTGIKRHRKHKEILKKARGMRGLRHRSVRKAKEALMHAGQDAYVGRKLKKRDFRSLWISRLNAALRSHGISYSRFVHGAKAQKIEIDRKILSTIAITDPNTFNQIATAVRKQQA